MTESHPDVGSLRETIETFDAILTDLTLQLDKALLEKASKLRLIATATTGLDHIDVPFAISQGIEVISLKGDISFLKEITATAELAWGLLLSTIRSLPSAVISVKKGSWNRADFRGHQLSGKTLGVLGYGRLGKMVSEYGRAFRMRVLVCDKLPMKTPEGISQVQFYELLQESDVISLHLPLEDDTRGLFSKKVFESMKPEAVLINTSRGAIVDEDAFVDALESKRLAGAGVDVIDGEWGTDFSSHPLIRYAQSHDNLIISPHIGGATYESQRMAYERIIQKLIRAMSSTQFHGI